MGPAGVMLGEEEEGGVKRIRPGKELETDGRKKKDELRGRERRERQKKGKKGRGGTEDEESVERKGGAEEGDLEGGGTEGRGPGRGRGQPQTEMLFGRESFENQRQKETDKSYLARKGIGKSTIERSELDWKDIGGSDLVRSESAELELDRTDLERSDLARSESAKSELE